MKDVDRWEECGQGHKPPRSLAGGLKPPLLLRGTGVNAVSGERLLGVSRGAKHILFSLQPCEVNVLIILFISQDCF